MTTSRPRSAFRAGLSAACAGGAALSLSACLSVSDLEETDRIGSFTLSSTQASLVPRRASPTATFFTTQPTELPTSRVVTDGCGTFNFVPETFTPGNLLGGETLQLRVGSNTFTMSERANPRRVYGLTSGESVPFVAGDSARFTIPGQAGGFPPGQIAVRMAEPLELRPLVVTEASQDLAFQWTPNGDANSSVILSMRYNVAITTDEPNAQLLCIVRDNGAYTIPATELGLYFTSNPASRRVNVLRWRTNTVRVDERSQLYVVSTIDTSFVLPVPAVSAQER